MSIGLAAAAPIAADAAKVRNPKGTRLYALVPAVALSVGGATAVPPTPKLHCWTIPNAEPTTPRLTASIVTPRIIRFLPGIIAVCAGFW